jgi:Ca-activated chloride channel family protein
MKRITAGLALGMLGAGAMANDAILVLDASGSMWGTIDGSTKVEIARAAVADLVRSWPAGDSLGLVAYGHRRKGDCADIETLLPASPVDANAFQAHVDALNAKGMTPLSAAVLHAADALRSSERKATVILVSDGEETCHLDPCETARQLEADGIDFTAHVIGFDVASDSTAERQLKCLAENTGGTYVAANDAQALTRALDAVSDATQPEPLPAAALRAPESAPAGTMLTIGWDGPSTAQDSIRVVDANGETRNWAYVGSDGSVELRLPPDAGDHVLAYIQNDATNRELTRRPLTITPSVFAIDAPATVAAGSEIQIRVEAPVGAQDSIVIARSGDEGYLSYAYVGDDKVVMLTAPDAPGAYELRYRFGDSQVVATRAIAVE